MKFAGFATLTLLALTLLSGNGLTQEPASTSAGIDPEALINQILQVDADQRARLRDAAFDATYVEGELKKDGAFEEKLRFMKRIFIKYFPDTAWFHELYVQYYKDGKLKSEKDCQKAAEERTEKKRRRGAMDISYPMIRPFTPRHRALYTITYQGIMPEKIGNYTCHKFRVDAIEPADSLINGDYFFESDGFHLVQVDFSPSKLVKRSMFKMNEMKMNLTFEPSADNFWLPAKFQIQMRAKAMWVIGVKVSGTEEYRNAVINTGIEDNLFEVHDDK